LAQATVNADRRRTRRTRGPVKLAIISVTRSVAAHISCRSSWPPPEMPPIRPGEESATNASMQSYPAKALSMRRAEDRASWLQRFWRPKASRLAPQESADHDAMLDHKERRRERRCVRFHTGSKDGTATTNPDIISRPDLGINVHITPPGFHPRHPLVFPVLLGGRTYASSIIQSSLRFSLAAIPWISGPLDLILRTSRCPRPNSNPTPPFSPNRGGVRPRVPDPPLSVINRRSCVRVAPAPISRSSGAGCARQLGVPRNRSRHSHPHPGPVRMAQLRESWYDEAARSLSSTPTH